MSFFTSLRNSVESVAAVAGNYFVPGSSLVTSNLVSKGSQDQLGSTIGQIAQIGSGAAGLGLLSGVGVQGSTIGLKEASAVKAGYNALFGSSSPAAAAGTVAAVAGGGAAPGGLSGLTLSGAGGLVPSGSYPMGAASALGLPAAQSAPGVASASPTSPDNKMLVWLAGGLVVLKLFILK